MRNNNQTNEQTKQNISPFRKAALWNALDPNDPYDIKKSMIARLPQHPARFMGQNLELVCLFQAAQIQRLAVYLQQMSNKIRAVETIQLDRHSYEIQIKQLADKLTFLNGIKLKNQKLQQFIKRQSQQMQILRQQKRSSEGFSELQNKYQSLLNELKITRENYTALQKSNKDLITEITEWRYKCEKTQKILNQERVRVESELKIKIQIALNQFRRNFQSREYQFKGEINILKENLSLKNQQIQFLSSKCESITKILAQKQNQLFRYQRGQIASQNSKTQELLKISNKLQNTIYQLQQSKKLNVGLKEQIDFLMQKLKNSQFQLAKRDQYIKKQKQSNQSEYQQRILELQNKMAIQNIQMQRVNEDNERKKRQISSQSQEIILFQQKLILYQRKIESNQRLIRQKQDKIRRFEIDLNLNQDKDSRIQLMANEISRLNYVLQEKLNEYKKTQLKLNELSNIDHQSQSIIRSKQQSVKLLQSRLREYEMKFYSLDETHRSNLQQVNKLSNLLISIQNQNVQLKKQMQLLKQKNVFSHNYQNQLKQVNEELNGKVTQNRKLREDNQHMYGQIQHLKKQILYVQTKSTEQINFINVKVQQKYNQIGFLQLKIQQKNNQNMSLSSKLQQRHNQSFKYTHQLQQKSNEIQILETTYITKEKNYIQKIETLQNSIPKMSEEINRLHQLLDKKKSQHLGLIHDFQIEREKFKTLQKKKSTELEMNIHEFSTKILFLESRSRNLQKQSQDWQEQRHNLSLKYSKLEEMLFESQKQLQRLRIFIQGKDQMIIQNEQKIKFLQISINQQESESLKFTNYQLKYQKQKDQYEQKIRILRFELQKTYQSVIQGKNDFMILKEETNRFKDQLNKKQIFTHENSALKLTIESLRGQLISLSNNYQQLQFSLNEYKTKLTIIQQQNFNLNSQSNEYKQKIKHIQMSNQKLVDQNKNSLVRDYETKLRSSNQRIQQLERRFIEIQTEFNQKQNQLSRTLNQLDGVKRNLQQSYAKIQNYEEKLSLLSSEIQRLELKGESHLSQDQNIVQDLNRQINEASIELINLKQILEEYQSINQHTIAERDELFRISHQQQHERQDLKNSLTQQKSFYENQIRKVLDKYNIIVEQIDQMRTTKTSQRQNIRQYKSTQQQQVNRLVGNYQSTLTIQRKKLHEASMNIQKQARALVIVQEQNKRLEHALVQVEDRYRSAQNNQIEQIKTQYINIRTENQELMRKLQEMNDYIIELEEERRENEAIREHYEILMNENDNLKLIQGQQRQKYRLLETELIKITRQVQLVKSSSELQIKQVEGHYFPIIEENEQNKKIINNLRVQISEMRSQVSIHMQFSAEWEQKYNTLYQAYNQMYAAYNEMKIQYESGNQKIREFQSKFSFYQLEFKKLSQLVEHLKIQKRSLSIQLQSFEGLEQKNKYLSEQIDQLYKIIKTLKQEISQVRIRLSKDNCLQRRIHEDMVLMVVLFAEIESLRKRVEESEREYENARRSSLSPFKVEYNKRKKQIFK